ncbi:hypothetical protein DM860_009300 [Cuscuta australis]|uniref:Ribosomal protein S10 domain-containing protein n=1 Tax=Cuscuta australis TaxID=267555 RepID=A0A328DFW5_9ASTE|nr:hypothetical protein DM860_009300 [Cuscuta australis]
MHRLSRRSLSAVLRAGASRQRNAAALNSSARLLNQLVGENGPTSRCYSALALERHSSTRTLSPYNASASMLFGSRHESTSAASDTSGAVTEKYEYQAERDDKGYAHPERIQKLVQNYSQFVSFPIYTWQEKGYTKEVEVDDDPAEGKTDGQDEPAEKKKKIKKVVEKYWDWDLTNETQPIWLRNPKEVTTEEYNEFYKKTFNEYMEPLASSHFTTEGEVEFRSVLYVPAASPAGKDDFINGKTKNIRLYVKRVFISSDFDGELFPRYLSFVKGVVDSNDLPLNVSREILQESRIPDNPAELGGKIYGMMSMALSGKWGGGGASPDFHQYSSPQTHNIIPDTVEAEVVEPAEAGGQK